MYKNLFKIIKIFAFTILLVLFFFLFTYLQRNVNVDRENITGLKSEKKNSLDAIFIGGSATFVYWQPLYAYKKFGFTSYNLASNTLQAESIITYVKYAMKYQTPKLFVIGLRPFQYYDDAGDNMGLRNSTDSLDIGILRLELINRSFNNRTNLEDRLSYYFDIIKYHSKLRTLLNPKNWKFIFNTFSNQKKGFYYVNKYEKLDTPKKFQCASRSELNKNNEKEFRNLCSYLKSINTNVLFTVCPYYIEQEHYSIYNSLSDIIKEYGFDYINTNDNYNEMGIDFSKDFYNISHVNIFGSNKYTNFLGEYIVNNYNLVNHNNDPVYNDWNELSNKYLITKEAWENEIQSLIDSKN